MKKGMLRPSPCKLSRLAISRSVLFVPGLLASPLAGQRCFYSSLLSRFQVEGMLLDFLDDILLLDFAFEATQRVL